MRERTIELATEDGNLDVFVCHPEEEGPHPAVIFYMDAPGIRGELRDMARRLGTAGYFVLLPNLYYRVGREGGYGFDRRRIRDDPGQRQKMSDVMDTLSNALVVQDTGTLLDQIREDAAAAPGAVGCVGYCMSGPFVVSAAAAYPGAIKAVASFHGVRMVTDLPDSPHRAIPGVSAEVYLAFAENDELVDRSDWRNLDEALADAGIPYRVEIYPDTGHGFVFQERPAHVKDAAERHWERLLALFSRNLKA